MSFGVAQIELPLHISRDSRWTSRINDYLGPVNVHKDIGTREIVVRDVILHVHFPHARVAELELSKIPSEDRKCWVVRASRANIEVPQDIRKAESWGNVIDSDPLPAGLGENNVLYLSCQSHVCAGRGDTLYCPIRQPNSYDLLICLGRSRCYPPR